jgi:hypothetical protein
VENMKKLIQIFIIFGLIAMMGGGVSGAEKAVTKEGTAEIVITVTSKEKYNPFAFLKIDNLKKKLCELKFDITNNAYGTLHYIDLNLTGFDDRGRKVRKYGAIPHINYKGGSRIPLVLGSTIRNVGSAKFKEECKYLTELRFDGIDEDSCVMRMLPENVSCSKFTILKSNVPSLKIKNGAKK